MLAPPTIIDASQSTLDVAAAVTALEQRGFCILRGLFEDALLDACDGRIEALLAHPAIAGTIGYGKVDHPKRVANPFVAGGPVIRLLLDERVIEIVESRMEGECILAETILKHDRATPYVYFPLHADFSPGWRKSSDSAFGLTVEALRDPVGIGGVLYLHDTSDGAFCYCEGTHTLLAPHGQSITAYPPDKRKAIEATMVRCDGRRGDLVLFDDRGFHGPHQPSTQDRRVILLDYYRVATFGRVQVSPMPVWTSDLGGLSQRQLRVLGAGADYMVPAADYTGTRFQRNPVYPILAWLIDHSYQLSDWRGRVKASLKRFRGTSRQP